MTTPSTGPHQFAMDAWISTAPFERLLNMTIEEAADGQATLTMPFYREYANGAGIMHGGALVSLADTAVVMAIKSILEPGSHFATIKMEVTFQHPVKKGLVTARAQVVSKVDRIIEGRVVVYDEEERAVMEYATCNGRENEIMFPPRWKMSWNRLRHRWKAVTPCNISDVNRLAVA